MLLSCPMQFRSSRSHGTRLIDLYSQRQEMRLAKPPEGFEQGSTRRGAPIPIRRVGIEMTNPAVRPSCERSDRFIRIVPGKPEQRSVRPPAGIDAQCRQRLHVALSPRSAGFDESFVRGMVHLSIRLSIGSPGF